MNAHSYDAIATGPFARLYPFYAEQILERTGVRSGTCLDLGCGGGYLGLALAERSKMRLVLLDESPEMVAKARINACQRTQAFTVWVLQASVQSIPLPDESMDLVISRGSIPFWKKLPNAFREIYRVLKPSGHAYVGGGLGTPEMRKAIMQEMSGRDPQWKRTGGPAVPQHPDGYYENALREANIPRFAVTRDETGTWVQFQKQTAKPHRAAKIAGI